MTTNLINFLEKNGKTLHLLKSKAKPTITDRKRKKIPIRGSISQYLDQKAKKDAGGFVLNLPGVVKPQKAAGGAKQAKDAKMGDN